MIDIDTDGIRLRLARFIVYKTNNNKKEFANMLGYSAQYLNRMLTDGSIGIAPVVNMLRTFPELNARWLLLGEGVMINSISNEIKRKLYTLLELEKYISVMTQSEIQRTKEGYEWSEQHIAHWERMLREQEKELDAIFSESASTHVTR